MWILIITLGFSNMHGGVAIDTAEFSTQDKCKDAGYKWELSISTYKSEVKNAAKWICVEK